MGVSALACVVCVSHGAAVTSGDLFRALEEHGIGFDTSKVERAAVVGILAAVDPAARLLPDKEAGELVGGATIDVAEQWPEGIAYLRLNGIRRGGGREVAQHLRTWCTNSQCGMIVDVRGAGGSSPPDIDGVASLFVPEDQLLYTLRDGMGRREEQRRSTGRPLGRCVPVVLLIDGETREGCEVLAEIVKGKAGVMLVGGRTRGEGRLRDAVALPGGESVYIATRRVAFPSEPGAEFKGVEPDIYTAGDDRGPGSLPPETRRDGSPISDEARRSRELALKVAGDHTLSRAVDILLGLSALRKIDHGAAPATNPPSQRTTD